VAGLVCLAVHPLVLLFGGLGLLILAAAAIGYAVES